MNRSILLLFLALLISTTLVFGQGIDYDEEAIAQEEEITQEEELTQEEEEDTAETATADPIIVPSSVLNNEFYTRSVRLNQQAKQAFENGDYDASAAYAERAAEQAQLSDEYVAMRIAEYAMARAHSRYTWAGSVGAATRYQREYQTATTAYNEAIQARQAEDWEGTTNAANRVIVALANVVGTGGQTGPSAGSEPPRQGLSNLPAQYTVRNWRTTGDCFWTIAGWSWVYGDSYHWRVLYEANKDKIPDPNNPNWIEPGIILDIPSLRGEVRSGMWDPDKN